MTAIFAHGTSSSTRATEPSLASSRPPAQTTAAFVASGSSSSNWSRRSMSPSPGDVTCLFALTYGSLRHACSQLLSEADLAENRGCPSLFLPRHWRRHVKSAMLHLISLARLAFVQTWRRTARSLAPCIGQKRDKAKRRRSQSPITIGSCSRTRQLATSPMLSAAASSAFIAAASTNGSAVTLPEGELLSAGCRCHKVAVLVKLLCKLSLEFRLCWVIMNDIG